MITARQKKSRKIRRKKALGLVETEGIITKEVKFGETSRIVTLLTRDLGKISAIANNVRTGRSRLLGGLFLFSYSKFELFEGRKKSGSLYRINEISLKEPFKNIRESIDKMAYASYFAEAANKASREGEPDEELLRLLLNVLYFTDRDICSYSLIKAAFEIKAADILGYAPSFEKCIKCGKEEELLYFDPEGGGVCCSGCGKLLKKHYVLNNTVRSLWSYIQKSSLKNAVSLEASEETLSYLTSLTENYLQQQLDCEFKTLDFLKKVINCG